MVSALALDHITKQATANKHAAPRVRNDITHWLHLCAHDPEITEM